MIITSIKLNNFQLFKSVSCDFKKLNCVTGQNLDSPNESGNGSGKSTLVLRAILFCLYGYCPEGIVIKDLIRFDTKEASVEIEIEKDNNKIRIIRKIPSSLQIYLNGNEVVANTASIKQEFITEQFEDINFFRQYRCVDSKNGISILDMGTVSIRKTLMMFIENYFAEIRLRLLAQKSERERLSIDKKLYKFHISEKRINILNAGEKSLNAQIETTTKEYTEQRNIVNNLLGEIRAKERIIENKLYEIAQAQKSGICPILKTKCIAIAKELSTEQKKDVAIEIAQYQDEIKDLRLQYATEDDYMNHVDIVNHNLVAEKRHIENLLTKLQQAEMFKEYKYTKADIMLYDESIKVLDNFSGAYIKEWLTSLAVIINNLLQQLNISVEFSADKDFLKVKDNDRVMKYDQLSTGQRCFLNTIFKLAILLQQNQTGLICLDDGLNDLDKTNFNNLMNVLKTLPFQAITVFQAYEDIEDVKHIVVTRKNGESNVS